jgi:hypothetical protein
MSRRINARTYGWLPATVMTGLVPAIHAVTWQHIF